MNLYNWENSAKANHKKVKKTGTVVFHPDETVDTGFDRLLKEYVVEKEHHGANNKSSGPKAPLMTAATAKVLATEMKFEGLLPCQAQCYRGVFNGRDVILHSRTGSGKTLAYALPLIERHLILEKKATDVDGPFLLIFVFSNDLAVQTKGVLAKIYPSLRIGVAGFDSTAGNVYDILIGTVRKMDHAIRGQKAAAAANALEEKEKEEEENLLNAQKGTKRVRKEEVAASKKKRGEEKAEDAEEDGDANESDDDDDNVDESSKGDVLVDNVRAIVIDEVDTTLGPRFSNVGRRVKNLLKYIRRANGSLTEGLLSDYRAHHYVLCGATIPNWVIKAGFLGVKKYYYQLVAPGGDKLPSSLTCYQLAVPEPKRVETAVALLQSQQSFLGRTVVFGTNKQIANLEGALKAAQQSAVQAAPAAAGKKGAKKSAPVLTVRTLTPAKDEMERVEAMMDFESKVANILLCTDIAARGLDFADVHTVLMLSVPKGNMAAETFVHRAGRTARVDRVGQCLLMCDKSETDIVDAIVKSSHVVFKKFTAEMGSGQAKDSVTRFQLTVKNPFKLTRPDAKVPTARQVLEKQLGEELLKIVRDATEENGNTEVLTFSVDASRSHEVKQKLWKYSLNELA